MAKNKLVTGVTILIIGVLWGFNPIYNWWGVNLVKYVMVCIQVAWFQPMSLIFPGLDHLSLQIGMKIKTPPGMYIF